MAGHTDATKIPTTPYWPERATVDAAAPASRVIRRSTARDAYIAVRFNVRWKAWVAIAAANSGIDGMRAIDDARLAHHLRCLRLLAAGFDWRIIKGGQRRTGRELDDPRLTDAEFDALYDGLTKGRRRNRRYERQRRQGAVGR